MNANTESAVDILPGTTSVPSEMGFYKDDLVAAGLATKPSTKGHAKIILRSARSSLLLLSDVDLLHVMGRVKKIAGAIRRAYNVQRCAFVTDGNAVMSIIPLHGLSSEWHPIVSDAKVFLKANPGYVTSQDGPEMSVSVLEEVCGKAQKVSGIQAPFDCTFNGAADDQNLFARIIKGELTQYRIWEDSDNVAFLTPFGNTIGFTVLVPRKHLSSDILGLDDHDYNKLILAAKKVAQVLTAALELDRCGMIFEGFEINYAHVKLIPVHDGIQSTVAQTANVSSEAAKFHDQYVGYVTSLDGPRSASVGELDVESLAIERDLGAPSIVALSS